jgi:chitodextrinase
MMRMLSSMFTAFRIFGLTLALLCGSSALSAQGSRTRDRIPPTAPATLVATAIAEHSVTLAWQPSTDNSGVFSYVICCAGATVTVSQTATSHTIDGLKAGQTYTFRVYAVDAAGTLSSASNPVTVTLPGQAAAPTKPVVTVLNIGPTHVSLGWSSTDDGPTIWYTISIDGQAVSTLNSRSAAFTCASVLVPAGCIPLNQQTTYTFTVRARDVDGNLSPVSDPVVVTTAAADPSDHTPPAPPMDITAENDGAHLILRWTAATDDVAPQAFIRYDVYVNDELRAVVVGQTSAQVEIEYGVNNGIAIVAVDTADNESAPGILTVAS